MILAQQNRLTLWVIKGVRTQMGNLRTPPIFAGFMAVLAALSAWAAGWPPFGIATNFALAAVIASYLTNHIQNKAS